MHVSSSHSKLSLPLIFYVSVYCGVCFLLSASNVTNIYTSWGSTTGVCITTSLWCIPMVGICIHLVLIHGPSQEHAKNLLNQCFEYGMINYNPTQQLPSAIQSLWWGIQLLVLVESPNPSAFHSWCGGSFSGLVQPNDMIDSESMMWLNLVILVWWLDIRLMNLLTPCWQNVLLLNHTFTLGS